MLFTYNYINHDLEKIQDWLEHLVKKIWCKPRNQLRITHLDLEFQKVVREVLFNSKKHDYLWKPILKIHNICRDKLTPRQRLLLEKWFDNNTNIEAICNNKSGVIPVTYDDISKVNANLAFELQNFCTNLWKEVRVRQPVINRVGNLMEHYKQFRAINGTGFCPFCGITRIEGIFSPIQEDYDHYLPKSKYAFNSVSMRNLMPICDKCNKKYKLQQDPLFDKKGLRRKAFYGYGSNHDISFIISLKKVNGASINTANLVPDNIDIEIISPGKEEEVIGWNEIYKIEERYKGIFCEKETGGDYWLQQVLGEMHALGESPANAIALIKRYASHSKWADVNFLKIPFLEGCQAAGLIR